MPPAPALGDRHRAGGKPYVERHFGARITFTDRTDPWDPAIRAELDRLAESYRSEGRHPAIVQLTGGSAALSIAGWVSGAAELKEDFAASDFMPELLVLACGSGLTAAGLALGFKHLGCVTRVLGVSVQQRAARLEPWMLEAANTAAAELGVTARLGPGDFDLLDDQIDPGYGVPSAASLAAVRLAGETEGLVLDPVYSGKGMAGLLAGARSGGLAGKSVAFLHSGGAPGLFAHAAAFAPGGVT